MNRAARRQYRGVQKNDRIKAQSRREFFAAALDMWAGHMEARRQWRAALRAQREGKS